MINVGELLCSIRKRIQRTNRSGKNVYKFNEMNMKTLNNKEFQKHTNILIRFKGCFEKKEICYIYAKKKECKYVYI